METPDKQVLQDKLFIDKRYTYGVPVDLFMDYYSVNNPEVQTTLKQYPSLCYLLGRITEEPQPLFNQKENKMESVHILVEGSGIFALTDKEDILRWKGIFNHMLGSARHAYFLADKLSGLTPVQKQKFIDEGYDFDTFGLDPVLLRDFMATVSHCGRRRSDEKIRYNLDDNVHKITDPSRAALDYLESMNAHESLTDLMRTEIDIKHLTFKGNEIIPIIGDAIYCYADWTFDQTPMSLGERFHNLGTRKRAPAETLDILKKCGLNFKSTLKKVVGENIWQEMTSAGPYNWETQIRKAYCSPSGLSLQEVFPLYVKQFPKEGK